MKLIFRRHYPNFIDIDIVPTPEEFSSVEDLLSDKWISDWKKELKFYRFSQSGNHLMAELDNGKTYWVIGYIEPLTDLGLPKWEAPVEEVKEETPENKEGSFYKLVEDEYREGFKELEKVLRKMLGTKE